MLGMFFRELELSGLEENRKEEDMSTNCVRCIKNERTGTDLLCDECRKELSTWELCQRCGRRYSEVWETSNELWRKLMSLDDQSGLCCMSCFDMLASSRGIALRWKCEDMKALSVEAGGE